jgi:hypothetical protein
MTTNMPTNSKGDARLLLKNLYAALGESGRAMTVQEYTAIANRQGFDNFGLNKALQHLRDELWIVYPQSTTRSLKLTPTGVQMADYLKYRNEDVLLSDPLPESLDSVRVELAYWELQLQRNFPRSPEWEHIKNRIDALRHKENTMIKPTPTVYILSGPGSRLNVESVDNSINHVTIAEGDVFPKLRSEIEASPLASSKREEILARLRDLEGAKGSPTYGARFRDFISVSADLTTVIAPFIQLLAAHIK